MEHLQLRRACPRRDKELSVLGKNKESEVAEALESFIEQGVIGDVLGVIKSGKEATVYLCEAAAPGRRLFAAKVYRSMDSALGSTYLRSSRNDAAYRQGRSTGSSRSDRGLALKTRTGRNLRFAHWITAEYETLTALHAAKADVPAPVARGDRVILMEYIGDDDGAAPTLSQVRFDRNKAQEVCDRLLWNIELMLTNNRIHGDLSPYNVLYRDDGRVTLIDFPQAVDPRSNSNALALLERDVERICSYLERFGATCDAPRFTRELWRRHVRSEL
jgi:RIO kinase 1